MRKRREQLRADGSPRVTMLGSPQYSQYELVGCNRFGTLLLGGWMTVLGDL
jgi:hypothetical protein